MKFKIGDKVMSKGITEDATIISTVKHPGSKRLYEIRLDANNVWKGIKWFFIENALELKEVNKMIKVKKYDLSKIKNLEKITEAAHKISLNGNYNETEDENIIKVKIRYGSSKYYFLLEYKNNANVIDYEIKEILNIKTKNKYKEIK